jgi:hypothetical protein
LGATAGEAFVGSGQTAAPSQDLVSPGAAAVYAGGGAGFFISNAFAPGTMGGHFATYTVDTPIVSAQFSKGGGFWGFSVTFGPGGLFGASIMTNTVTKTVVGSGTCDGGVGSPGILCECSWLLVIWLFSMIHYKVVFDITQKAFDWRFPAIGFLFVIVGMILA